VHSRIVYPNDREFVKFGGTRYPCSSTKECGMSHNGRPIRLIQVGMGGWGRDWARGVLPGCADIERVACVDLHAPTLLEVQREFDVPAAICFTSLQSALAAVDADAVLITAALPGHVPAALEALQTGKHVLLEKPFAPSVAEAREVVAAAERADRVLMISQNYRYYPAVRAVADLIRQQTLGPISSVSLDFRKYANTQPRGDNRHYEITHPLLLDMAIHHFDLLRLVLGQEPTSVFCHAWNPPWSNFRDPAAAVASIQFDGGAVVEYRGNWVSTAPATPWAGEWRIECEGGEIRWSSRADFTLDADVVTIHPRGKRARRLPLPTPECWDRAGALIAFVEAIRSGVEPETSGRRNLATLALTFAAIASAESGQPQPVVAEQPTLV
jgi:predicted dehydrogenase